MGDIKVKDFLFGITQLQTDGEYHLQELLSVGPGFVFSGHTDDLHRDGAPSPHHLARPGVFNHGLEKSDWVEAMMAEKLLVFKLDEAGDIFLGIAVGSWEAPLPIVGDAGSQQFPVFGRQNGGIGIVELRDRDAQKKKKQACQKQACPNHPFPLFGHFTTTGRAGTM